MRGEEGGAGDVGLTLNLEASTLSPMQEDKMMECRYICMKPFLPGQAYDSEVGEEGNGWERGKVRVRVLRNTPKPSHFFTFHLVPVCVVHVARRSWTCPSLPPPPFDPTSMHACFGMQ